MRRAAVMGLALLMDGLLGEPPEALHPVVWMGRTVGAMERRAPSGERGHAARMAWGAGTVALVGGASWWGASLAERRSGGGAGLLVEAWLLKSCFAYRALEAAAGAVISALDEGDLHTARAALRSLVSRDRAEMSAAMVSAATIESVSENLSDSLTAPLFAYAFGGLPAAFVYRAVNTADAMIGYRGAHEYTGKVAARTDDLLNLIPARMTAAAIALASGKDFGRTAMLSFRDHALTESPNAGWPMSAAAGALNVSLEKPGHYHLNPHARTPDARDARRAVSLIRRAALLCAVLSLLLAVYRERG